MMRQQSGLLICNFREVLFQHRGDAGVKLTPLAAKQGLVGGILKQGVLEEIDAVRRRAATVKKLRLDERLQRLLQPMLGKPVSHRAYRLIRKLSAERRTDLRYLFCRAQTIEAGDQQALQGAGNRKRRNRAVEQIFVVKFEQQATLQHSLDQLFDKQWHSIRMV